LFGLRQFAGVIPGKQNPLAISPKGFLFLKCGLFALFGRADFESDSFPIASEQLKNVL